MLYLPLPLTSIQRVESLLHLPQQYEVIVLIMTIAILFGVHSILTRTSAQRVESLLHLLQQHVSWIWTSCTYYDNCYSVWSSLLYLSWQLLLCVEFFAVLTTTTATRRVELASAISASWMASLWLSVMFRPFTRLQVPYWKNVQNVYL